MDVWYELNNKKIYLSHDNYLNRTVAIMELEECDEAEIELYKRLEGKKIEGILNIYRVDKGKNGVSVILEMQNGHFYSEEDDIPNKRISGLKKKLRKKGIIVSDATQSLWITDDGSIIFLEYDIVPLDVYRRGKGSMPFYLLIPTILMAVAGVFFIVNSKSEDNIQHDEKSTVDYSIGQTVAEIESTEEPTTERQTTVVELSETEESETETLEETQTEPETTTVETSVEVTSAEETTEEETTAPEPQIITGKCGDNVFYNYYFDTKTLEITGSGPTYDYSESYDSYSGSIFCNNHELAQYVDEIDNVIVTGDITRIGDYFFDGLFCRNNITLKLPDSVREIGTRAFTYVGGIDKVVFGKNFEIIGEEAFELCTIKVIDFSNSKVKYTNSYMFCSCYELTDIYFSKMIESVVYNPENPECDYSGDYGTGYYIYDDEGNVIDEYTAYPTLHLYAGTNPKGLIIGGKNKIVYSDGTVISRPTKIEGKCGDDVRYTYYTETKVLEITGNGATYDYDQSYGIVNEIDFERYEYEIASVNIKGNITRIGNNFFCRLFMNEYTPNANYTLIIPDSVEEIGDYAFAGSSFSEIICGKKLKSIGESAFWSCERLTKVDLKNTKVRLTNRDMFRQCWILSDIYFPKTIENIASNEEIENNTYGGDEYYYFINDFKVVKNCTFPNFHIYKDAQPEGLIANGKNKVIYYKE